MGKGFILRVRKTRSSLQSEQYTVIAQRPRSVKQKTEKDIDTISLEKGDLRQIVIELLCHRGGPKGPEIGRIFVLDHGTVSRECNRLQQSIRKTKKYENCWT